MVMVVDADSSKEEEEETGTNLLSFDNYEYLLKAIFQHILISNKSGVKGNSNVPFDQIVADLGLKIYKAL